MSNNKHLNDHMKTALEAVSKGRQILLDHFGRVQQVKEKPRAGLVSEVDHLVEKTMQEHLKKTTGFDFLGEESSGWEQGRGAVSAENLWVLDPLDGTNNYIYGLPWYCISLGLVQNNEITLGIVDMPGMNQQFRSIQGQGASNNGSPITISQRKDPGEFLWATGFNSKHESRFLEQVSTVTPVVNGSVGVRRMGSAAIDLCMVAKGTFDGYWEHRLNPWDLAAGVLMVKEAGGLVQNYGTDSFNLFEGSVLAGTSESVNHFKNQIDLAGIRFST